MPSSWDATLSSLSSSLNATQGSGGLGGVTAGADVLYSQFSDVKSSLGYLKTIVDNFYAKAWVTDADVASGAAIAYSKLSLSNSIVAGDLTTGCVTSAKIADGTIVNGDISSSAAIATSKVASGTLTSGTILVTDSTTTPSYGVKRSDGAYYLSGDSGGWAFGGSSGADSGTLKVGVIASQSTYNNTTGNAANGYVFGSGSSYSLGRSTSSIKYKTDVEQYALDPAQLLAFRGVSYRSLCEADDPDRRFVGFIAEEAVAAGLDEFVQFDGDEPEGFNYGHFTAALLELCKYQEERINDLEARLSALEG